jgi:membrane-bound ClpP family serine protease
MTKKGESSGMKAWVIVLVALLDDIALLALLFFILWAFNVEIPLYLIIIIGLAAGTFVFIVHRAIVPSLRRKKVAGKEGMIGLTGEVTQALKPKGVIKIGDEYWKAKSSSGDIDVGDEVEVVDIDGLNLEVELKKHE